jgi:hypothetical protein
MNKLILPLIVIILVVSGVIGWSFINRPTIVPITKIEIPAEKKVTPTSIVINTPTITETISQSTPLKYANPSVTIDAIETAVPSKKWTDLLPFMTTNVTLIKYGTSCCGTVSKNQAISELSYLNDATSPWNFSETNPIALSLESKDPEHFKETWIGTSKDYYAVGFKWNDDFLIEKVSMVNDYRLITSN